MLKAFNFIVIRPLKLHIIMYSSFPTFFDCGSAIMWRHYEIIIAEFFTELTGEPTGNRKVERIHSVNFFNRRFKNPWRNCQSLIDPFLYSPKVMILNGWCMPAKERSLPTELCDNFKVRDEQSRQYHFQGSKVCHLRISLRPKIKEKPNNHISIGEAAWSCVSLFVTWWCGSWTIFHLRKWIVSFVYIYVFICHFFRIHSWNIIQP